MLVWLTGLVVVALLGGVAVLEWTPARTAQAGQTALDAGLAEHGPGHLLPPWHAPNPGLALIDLPDPVPHADWQTGAGELHAFDPATEDLMLVWDDRTGADPDARLRPSAADPSILELCTGEAVYARVPASTGVKAPHVAVIPLSAAERAGLMAGGAPPRPL